MSNYPNTTLRVANSNLEAQSDQSTQGIYLSTSDLSISYHGKTALKDISMSVAANRTTAVIGPSGCGKTSFLNCINRLTDLIPGCQVRGSIKTNNTEIIGSAIDVVRLRTKIGMIFQKPNPFPLSIWKNLSLPLSEHGLRGKDEVEESITNALKDVGLWDEVKNRMHDSAFTLSGGQQQRLCIARALILEPEALLMDEPCSSLDPISTGIIEDLMAGLKDRYTLVVVTHNLAQAKRVSDYAAFFWPIEESGTLVEYDRTDRLFNSPGNSLTKSYINGIRG